MILFSSHFFVTSILMTEYCIWWRQECADGGSKGIDHKTKVKTNENIRSPQDVLQLCTRQVGTGEMIKYKKKA